MLVICPASESSVFSSLTAPARPADLTEAAADAVAIEDGRDMEEDLVHKP